jgi:hypothetical protein
MSLNSPVLARTLMIVVPLAFGGLSLLHGQDGNWDLYNYHLYNPYAFLNGKLDIDLAPAGVQSYFNPALDLVHFALLTGPWPPLSGLVLGVVHGLHFALLYAIARVVLTDLPVADAIRVPIFLALAGSLSANLLVAVGNGMGDTTTSVLELTALLILVSSASRLQHWSRALGAALLGAGFASGLGVGLKLTSVIYTAAMCLALLASEGSVRARARNALVFVLGAAAGFALTGGFWLVEMWSRFGNPLYPQFGVLFPSPLAESIGSVDRRWPPANVLEALTWPFVLSFDPVRVDGLRVYQLGWALCYVALLSWAAMRLRPAWRAKLQGVLTPPASFLLQFIVISFAIWTGLFSIYRYLVPVETLLPLVLWVVLCQIFAYARARAYAKRLIVLCVAGSLMLMFRTYGHVEWTDPPYRVAVPSDLDAGRDVIVVAEQPMAWIGVGFPPGVAFASVLSSFPESKRYAQRLRKMIGERGGNAYLMLDAERNTRLDTVNRANRKLTEWGVLDSAAGCAALGWLVEHTGLRASLRRLTTATDARCELVLPPNLEIDLAARNDEKYQDIARRIARYALLPDRASCRTYAAYYGDRYRPYRLCRLRVGAAP